MKSGETSITRAANNSHASFTSIRDTLYHVRPTALKPAQAFATVSSIGTGLGAKEIKTICNACVAAQKNINMNNLQEQYAHRDAALDTALQYIRARLDKSAFIADVTGGHSRYIPSNHGVGTNITPDDHAIIIMHTKTHSMMVVVDVMPGAPVHKVFSSPQDIVDTCGSGNNTSAERFVITALADYMMAGTYAWRNSVNRDTGEVLWKDGNNSTNSEIQAARELKNNSPAIAFPPIHYYPLSVPREKVEGAPADPSTVEEFKRSRNQRPSNRR